jgi:3-deoxy-D-manno-octulosonic-acid transferase
VYKLIYNAFILPLLRGGFYLLSPFVSKIRNGLAGRVGLIKRVQSFTTRRAAAKLVLFHCASAGELEALRPLAARLHRQDVHSALSYFSPSAVRPALAADEFDFKDYSPVDARSSVRAYLQTLNPDLIAITKHDVWPNVVWTARELGIPVLLINGNFHPGSLKTNPLLRGFHRAVYGSLNAIYTVSADDARRARKFSGNKTTVTDCGDSRFDRVIARRDLHPDLPPLLEKICNERFVIVAGSTHPRDEELLCAAHVEWRKSSANPLLVVVPHDPSPQAQSRILQLAARHNLSTSEIESADILLVNQSGLLADLYRLGHFAYVGGAFGKGIHSVLEPMAMGLPVICGPRINVAHEAREARERGLLGVVTSAAELRQLGSDWINDPEKLSALSSQVRDFVAAHSGSTERLAEHILTALHCAPDRH